MQFLFPGFLWALSLLALPIIIHLFYFKRYKKVLFTNVRFLKELVEETSSRNKLKNLLILLTRLLALSALILAFAQPYLPKRVDENIQFNAVSIFIDNSHSMSADSEEGSLFSLAKKRAVEIINGYTEYDKFQIISHDLSGKQLRLLSKSDALTAVQEINEGPVVNLMSRILKKQSQTLSGIEGFKKESYIISDFQKSIVDVSTDQIDSTINFHLVPLQRINENNLSLDSAYFVSPVIIPNQINSLVFNLHNHGINPIENVRVSYSLNGQEFPHKSLNINSKQNLTDTLKVFVDNSSNQKLIIKIKDYPILFDDEYFTSFQVDQEINVLAIYDNIIPQALFNALSSMPYFKPVFVNSNSLDYSKFSNFKLIVLCDLNELSSGFTKELFKATLLGTNIIFFPKPDANAQTYQSLENQFSLNSISNFEKTRKEVGSINLESEVFSDVFTNPNANIKLPFSTGQYTLRKGLSSETILSYRDGSPYLIKTQANIGYIYTFASPLAEEYGNLIKSPEILLPFIFKAAISGNSKINLAYTIGQDEVILLPKSQEIPITEKGLTLSGPEEFIPSIRPAGNQIALELYDQIKKPGIYEVKNQNKIIGLIAFNENRLESNLDKIPDVQLNEYFGINAEIINQKGLTDLGIAIKESKSKKSLWWILVILSIIFLILESLLIRLWRST
ncbi:MAG: BatA domain-containing protein [Saprospiraceae bacterium]|nr:BatA domain-containing protein [Candidatus Vicinibacter affinis]